MNCGLRHFGNDVMQSCMTERTSHWRDFGSALSFQTRLTQIKPVLPLSKEHGSQVKDQGRRQCCHNKHKKFPYRLTRDVSLLSWYASYKFESSLAVLNCIHSASFHNIFHVNAVGISDQWHTKHYRFAYRIALVHCLAVNAMFLFPHVRRRHYNDDAL
jgi:hypothetical protein